MNYLSFSVHTPSTNRYIYTQINIHKYILTYIHAHVYMFTYMHTHTYTPTESLLKD
jgi:hypothetical protein